MENKFHVLVDSDAFVGRLYKKDSHHERSLSLFAKLEAANNTLTTTSMVVAETVTVLGLRSGPALARRFLLILRRSGLAIIHIDEKLQQEAIRLFEAQNKPGISVANCANVAVMRRFHIPQILSFDQTYEQQFRVSLANGR